MGTTAKHTEGEWKAVIAPPNPPHVYGPRKRPYVVGPDGSMICEVCDNSPHAEANATLIAAAPELLAALQAVTDALLQWMEIADDDDKRDSDNEAHAAARAAIAKAEGRTA